MLLHIDLAGPAESLRHAQAILGLVLHRISPSKDGIYVDAASALKAAERDPASAAPASHGTVSAGGGAPSHNPNGASTIDTASAAPPADAAPAQSAETAAAPKRTRRTKAEMEAARAAGQAPAPSPSVSATAPAPAAATAAPLVSDPFNIAPAFPAVQPAPQPEPTPAGAAPTLRDCETAVTKVLTVKGFDAATALLAEFGVMAIAQLKPEQYAALVAKAGQVAP